MKFEHKKQKVVPIRHFLFRLGRYGVFALLLIGISVIIGTVGYHQVAHLFWIDSFHMSCMILTGMGPVVEMTTDNAKLFSSFYALYSGIAFFKYFGRYFCAYYSSTFAYSARASWQ